LQALTRPRFDSVALARQWLEFVEQAGKESALQRRRASLTLRLLIDLLNDALRLSVDAEPVAANAAEAVSLKKLANALGADQLLEVLNRCLEADAQIDRYVQLVLVIEALADALGQHVGAGAVR
jgi:DNA polymerase-3 subunit delta'